MSAIRPSQRVSVAGNDPVSEPEYMQSRTPAHRYLAMDGLRGVAALLVVLLHAEWPNHLTTNRIVQNGFLAVDLFFIISGFVIAANYLHRLTEWRQALSFLGLRGFRLYPLHVAVLGAFVALELLKLYASRGIGVAPGAQPPFTGTSSVPALMANVLLLQGLHLFPYTTWNGPSWSISCEFAAYVVFAVAVLSRLLRSRASFWIGGALAITGYVLLALSRGTLDLTADWGVVRCFCGFMLGAMVFRVSKRDRNWLTGTRLTIVEFAIFGGALVGMAVLSGPAAIFEIPLLVAVIYILQSDAGPIARALSLRPAQWLGRISYSVYMVHDFLVVCMLIVLKRVFSVPLAMYSFREAPLVAVNPWVGDILVLALVGCVLVAAVYTNAAIEEPGRVFGRKLITR